MSKANIVATVKAFDVKDNALWEIDNSPNLEIVRKVTGEPDITAADVDKATGGLRRPSQPQDSTVKADSVEPVAPTQESDTKAKFDAARERLAEIEVELEEAHQHRSQVSLAIDNLVKRKDVELKLIEKLAPSVTFAEGVKAIQQQTARRLADQKAAVEKAGVALKAIGVTVYPSKLDEVYATRKTSQEQAVARAAHIAQRSQEQKEMRG